jgi:hypothetical protein
MTCQLLTPWRSYPTLVARRGISDRTTNRTLYHLPTLVRSAGKAAPPASVWRNRAEIQVSWEPGLRPMSTGWAACFACEHLHNYGLRGPPCARRRISASFSAGGCRRDGDRRLGVFSGLRLIAAATLTGFGTTLEIWETFIMTTLSHGSSLPGNRARAKTAGR